MKLAAGGSNPLSVRQRKGEAMSLVKFREVLSPHGNDSTISPTSG